MTHLPTYEPNFPRGDSGWYNGGEMHGRALGDWLDSHFPRGLAGSAQNAFRFAIAFFASQPRYTLEEALDLAIRKIREQYPDFVPKVTLR